MTLNGSDVKVAVLRFGYVGQPLIVSTLILSVALFKICFHRLKGLSKWFPESCMLILLGLFFGAIFKLDRHNEWHKYLVFDSRVFFLLLLPPIILEAAYCLRDRAFFANLGPILLFAVIGTLLNAGMLASALYGMQFSGITETWNLSLVDCLVFGSAIASVDPVAVLSIFQEIGVNKVIYFMVFDGVAVVMYNLMLEMKPLPSVSAHEIELGAAAFLATSICGISIGCVCGFVTGYITKYIATKKVQVVEPILLFGFGYLSYVLAELFHFSGIISIICCGLIQAQYAMQNISSKSRISVHYFSKVTSSVTESLIFIILGVMLVNEPSFWNQWKTDFSFLSLLFMILIRFVVVLSLTFVVNTCLLGSRRITYKEQFVVAYGGLRGAIAFSLVFMLDEESFKSRDVFLSATYFIILFTVFIQGTTMKPMVEFFEINLQITLKRTLFQEMNKSVINDVVAGIEEIVGYEQMHFWMGLSRYCERYLINPIVRKDAYTSGGRFISTYQEQSLHYGRMSPCPDMPQYPEIRIEQMGGMAEDDLRLMDHDQLLTASPGPSGAVSAGIGKLHENVERRSDQISAVQENVNLQSLFRAKHKKSQLHIAMHCNALDRNLSHEDESEMRIQGEFHRLAQLREEYSPLLMSTESCINLRSAPPPHLREREREAGRGRGPRTFSLGSRSMTSAPLGYFNAGADHLPGTPDTDEEDANRRMEFLVGKKEDTHKKDDNWERGPDEG